MTDPQRQMRNVEDIYPLAPTHLGMLFHTVAEPESGVYLDQVLCTFDGALDHHTFRAAWDEVVGRHAALRTAFLWDGLETPLQVVRETVQVPWSTPTWADEFAGLSVQEQRARVDELLEQDRRTSFDLAQAPLLRLRVWPAGDDRSLMLFTFHHLIADGWAIRVVLDEVQAIYRAGSATAAGLDEPPRYRDFIEWLGNQDSDRASEVWRDELSGFLAPTPLTCPTGQPALAGAAGQRIDRVIDASATAAIAAAAAQTRVTVSTLVHGAWAIVLGQWTRERDVVFGVTVAGRPAGLPGIDRGVGLFINTVPRRIRLDPAATVGEWLRELQTRFTDLREVEHSSLAQVQRSSDIAPGQALFDSIVVFENHPAGDSPAESGQLSLTGIEFYEQSNYPLAILVVPGNELLLRIVYDGREYRAEWINKLLDQLCLAIKSLALHPDLRLDELDLVTDQDARQLQAWNGGAQSDSTADSEAATIHDLIEAVAVEHPDKPAVIGSARQLTYRELDERANAVAHHLQAQGVAEGDRVGVRIDRSTEQIIAILGVLKAGAAYVPLDPGYPDARNQLMASAVGVRAELHEVVDGHLPTPPNIDRRPTDAAYVIFTSGSTGRPKGVEISHQNLIYSTTARTTHYGAGPTAFLLLSSFAFDSSIVGIFWTLCSGGAIVLPSPGEEQDMARLRSLIDQHKVSHLLALPSLYELLLEDDQLKLDSLKVAIVAGEACPSSTVERHFANLPATELHNEYGPTEATVWSTVHRIERADAERSVPIGRPISGAETWVLDADRRVVPIGFPGELWIGGPGLAGGYVNEAALTQDRFAQVDIAELGPRRLYGSGDLVVHRQDGALLFLGRVDSQVKIRGHRIEVGEIESALTAVPGVADAAVIARQVSGKRTQLVAYVVGPDDEGSSRLGDTLASELPDYMIPGRFVALDSLPRLPNGKVDRRSLPEPLTPLASNTIAAPVTPAERCLADLWLELLELEAVSIDDDFFELGGDSIVSIQMVSRARRSDLHLEPRDIVLNPTIRGLAAAADARGDLQPRPDPQADSDPVVPLGPMQRWFLELDLVCPSHWNQSQLFEVPNNIDVQALRMALQACVNAHPQLRACFEHRDGEWVQEIQPVHDLAFSVVANQDKLFAIQAGFALSARPPIAAAMLRRADEPAWLLVAVHHLVMDVVSWGILIDDLAEAYEQSQQGRPVSLPQPTVSYGEWVDHHEARPSLDAAAGLNVPVDHDGPGYGTEATAAKVLTYLTAVETRLLVEDAGAAYRTSVEDLLATGLALTIASWSKGTVVEFGVEHHGRPNEMDLSRTIGWFTNASVIRVEMHPGDETGDTIKSVKEQLRSGRHLGRPQSGINLNYLGRRSTTEPNKLFRLLEGGADATSRDPQNVRTELIDVVIGVSDGAIWARFNYSRARHDEATIQALAESFAANLRHVIDWCCQAGTGGLTPSDFPEAALAQDELDSFLDEIL